MPIDSSLAACPAGTDRFAPERTIDCGHIAERRRVVEMLRELAGNHAYMAAHARNADTQRKYEEPARLFTLAADEIEGAAK